MDEFEVRAYQTSLSLFPLHVYFSLRTIHIWHFKVVLSIFLLSPARNMIVSQMAILSLSFYNAGHCGKSVTGPQ